MYISEEIKTKLYDKDYQKWDGEILVWVKERTDWIRKDRKMFVTYRYRDTHGILREIKYDPIYVKQNEGIYVEGTWRTKEDGTRYWRDPFWIYNPASLRIIEERIIVE